MEKITEIIEIVSCDSALELLKECGNKNKKVCLPLVLCIGKLNSLTPFNRQVLSEYDSKETSYDFTEDFKKLKQMNNNCKKIRVWSSHLDCNDYCLLLLICYLFQEQEISVIFSEEISWYATTLSAISKEEIPELEKREHTLTKGQKEDYSKEWVHIANCNKELRFMINGTVISCNFDFLDNYIMDRLSQTGKIPIFRFVADLMGNSPIPNVMYSDWIYFYLIERLEKIGKIKSDTIDNKKYIDCIR